MNKLILIFAVVLAIVSCNSEKTFEVKGILSSAADQTLILEHRGLGGIEFVDSLKMKENGKFSFKGKANPNPEFYQLRIGNQAAVFVVDSLETLVVSADANDLSATFDVKDSPVNTQIKQIDKRTQGLKKIIDGLNNKHSAKQIDDVVYLTELDSVLTEYKAEISKLILGNPAGAAAYYAVFQKINDQLIFNPYDKKDYAMYGAVATSWDRFYPETPRSKHLHDFVVNALKTRRQEEKQAALFENAQVVSSVNMPDIELADVGGAKVSLSSLKGKTVVLDFTVYNSQFSPKHNIDLKKVYDKYRSSGFEIYQISLDSDEHFWKNAANNLPWITVRDPQSVYSSFLSVYNVNKVPTAFVIDKKGDVVARVEDYGNLDAEVTKAM